MNLKAKTIDNIYIGLIILLFFGIFFGFFFISLSQFLLLGIWLFEGGFKEKFSRLKQDKPALFFLSIYFIFLTGALWSSDIQATLQDLRIKLPLFSLPFLLLTKKNPFHKTQIDYILNAFVLLTFAKTFQSYFYLITTENATLELFTADLSHIRYSIYVLFSIFVLIYRIKKTNETKKHILYGISIIYLSISLVLLQSLTALIAYWILISGLMIYYLFKTSKLYVRLTFLFFLLFSIIFIPLYLYRQVQNFLTIKDPPVEKLDKKTINGRPYWHNIKNPFIENGYHVGYYICDKEMRKEWNKRSNFNYDSLDIKHQKIKYTLMRYLTSKGLRKDSVGIWSLTDEDIKNIEAGYTNYKYTNELSLNARIYKVIWQFYVYNHTKKADNQSLTSRWEFLKTGFNLFKKNWLTGVGTGDCKKEILKEYEIEKSKLSPEYRNLPHNEYLSILLAVGLFLGSWVIFAFIAPYFINKKYKNFLPTAFFIIFILSMFTDDILIRASSINFYVVFYTLLILINPKNQENDNTRIN